MFFSRWEGLPSGRGAGKVGLTGYLPAACGAGLTGGRHPAAPLSARFGSFDLEPSWASWTQRPVPGRDPGVDKQLPCVGAGILVVGPLGRHKHISCTIHNNKL